MNREEFKNLTEEFYAQNRLPFGETPESMLEKYDRRLNYNYPRSFSNKRELILRRDNYQCQICCSHKNLVIHHKDKNIKNNSEENLITLCPSHHKLIHSQPRKFKKLLGEK